MRDNAEVPITLPEFLLARLAEDEAESDKWHVGDCELVWRVDGDWPCNCAAKARVLAECDAKRRIVEEMTWHIDSVVSHHGTDAVHRSSEENVLRLLALPYADHPDYRPEWEL